ncbi:MAG: hypothetical protein COX57_12605 [Alphaproteobacteria bacterium CG_4_10_14_0_2_um_filter_63_37]|nr:MAG: hypothetical protein AUJ55_11765 [Proteobacteria bacterium CG1_02_64_396]PJA23651.1 MAG: hypothetical protein COX57_12605 [Alphaproteobacteria bacterium CG_4_10_14_0_2_um_filter_63_37]
MSNAAASLSLSTYLRMGWRNLMRNPRRTLLTLSSLIVGIGSLTLLGALVDGWMVDMRDNFVLTQSGHLQIHQAGFEQERQIKDFIPDPAPIDAVLRDQPNIRAWTHRIRASGLASVAGASTGAEIVGIQPEQEGQTSRLRSFLHQGVWLDPNDPRGLLLGIRLAENLGIEIGDKVVLMTQAPNGEIVSELFRLRGILRAAAQEVDATLALINLTTAQRWIGLGNGVTDVVVRMQVHGQEQALQAAITPILGPQREVMLWWEIDPLVKQWVELGDVSNYVILVIVVVVVLAQILNTMLMALMERVREFGLMEALGTGKRQLFTMVLWESVVLVMTGSLIGWGIGLGWVIYLQVDGIDLSAFADSLAFVYMSPVMKPILTLKTEVLILTTSFLAALIAGLYPAWKATRLQPVEAMREV